MKSLATTLALFLITTPTLANTTVNCDDVKLKKSKGNLTFKMKDCERTEDGATENLIPIRIRIKESAFKKFKYNKDFIKEVQIREVNGKYNIKATTDGPVFIQSEPLDANEIIVEVNGEEKNIADAVIDGLPLGYRLTIWFFQYYPVIFAVIGLLILL